MLLVILLIPVLVFLARALTWLSSSSNFRSLRHQQKLRSSYTLEAGVSHAASLLMEDATWEDGFDHEKLTRLDGSYTVTFQDAATPYVVGNSVNNIFGTEWRDGPRGPASVMPGTVELIVHAQDGSQQTDGRFLFRAILNNKAEFALSTEGRVVMNGNVDVTGVENVRDGEDGPGFSNEDSWMPVDAGLHANFFSSDQNAISWTKKTATDKATFSGKVSTPSRGANAITFEGTQGTDYSAGSIETNTAKLGVPSPEIIQSVQANSSAPAPRVSPFATTTLSAGKFYAGSNMDVQGDLVLNGTDLYVEGNLNVNGSIIGTGSVYVTGETNFKGDAEISAGAEGVALYSEGPVSLSGFNGREYMLRLRQRYPEIDQYYRTYTSNMAAASDTTPDAVQRGQASRASAAIAQVSAVVDRDVPNGSPTSDFVKDQLRGFKAIVDATSADNTWSRREMGGAHRKITYGLDRLGTAYFKGILVSNAYIHTESSVGVVGAVWASGSNKNVAPKVLDDGTTIRSGDIYLGDNTSLLMNKELLEDDETVKPNTIKGLQLLSWDQ